jgi:hypothetical protein
MPKPSPDQVLDAMAATFRERNAVYGSNYLRVGDVMAALFPEGVTLRTSEDFTRWHLLELVVVKLTRFATSNLSHPDSVHDLGVYAAMLETLLPE